MVRDQPGRRRADRRVRGERRVDRGAHRGRLPGLRHEVEVEGRVQLTRAEVLRETIDVWEPQLTDEDPRPRVAVGDGAPAAVDVMKLVAVGVGVATRCRFGRDLRQGRILDQQGGRVDTDPGRAAVEPEAEDFLVLATDLWMIPVEIRLGGREQVQVPLAGRTIGVHRPSPRRPGEVRRPLGRDLVAVGSAPGAEPEPRSLGRAGRRCERGLEPGVLVGHVIGNDVDDRADPESRGLGDQLLGFLERAEGRVDRAVVGDVVATVGQRGAVPRREPDGIDAERRQIWKARPDAGQVADAVAVAVGEAPDVELVDDRVTPPRAWVTDTSDVGMAGGVGDGLGHRWRRTSDSGSRSGHRRRTATWSSLPGKVHDLTSGCKN